MNNHVDFKNNQTGLTSVVSLFILSLVLASTLLVTSIILNEVKISLGLSNNISAFYTAESGIEKALYYIKYSRQQSDFSYFTNLSNTGNNIYELDTERKFTLSTTTINAKSFLAYNLTVNNPVHLDIIDPAGSLNPIDWGEVDKYAVTWNIKDCFPEHVSDRLETTFTSFDANFLNPNTQTNINICNCSHSTDNCAEINYSNISSNFYYRFSFKPLNAPVSSLSFDLINNNQTRGILSEVMIESRGTYHGSQFNIRARLPALSRASDIFSYVIFSEEDLSKGN